MVLIYHKPVHYVYSFFCRLGSFVLGHHGQALYLLHVQLEPLCDAASILFVSLVEEGCLAQLDALLGAFTGSM